MKIQALRLLLLLSTTFVGLFCWAGLLYPYNRLAVKDLDQMNQLIQSKIQESRKEKGDQIQPLKEALQAVYTRPNEDFMIEKILAPLKNELDEHEAWESTIKALVKEATGALKNPRSFTAVVQVSYALFLSNLIAEMKPKIQESPFEKSVVKSIADAGLELTKSARDERKLRMMKSFESPSDLAKRVLKAIDDAEMQKKEDEQLKKEGKKKTKEVET